MISEMKMRPPRGTEVATWSTLQNVEDVDSRLSDNDSAFLDAVGGILSRHQATEKYHVTLLHSHFHLSAEETLVEACESGSGRITTSVRMLQELESSSAFEPKSWMFSDKAGEGGLEMDILVWASASDLPHGPSTDAEAALFAELAQAFHAFGCSRRFGLSLAGVEAGPGKVWSESTDFDGRTLVQIQESESDVLLRESTITAHKFDATGKYRFVMACCQKWSAGWGHSTGKHPRGLC